MLDTLPARLVAAMNGWPPELIWLLLLVVCFAAILLLARLFGAAGLYVFLVVGILAANVQVLKAVQSSLFADPVPDGTIVFATTYFATDILTEFYGRRAARRGVMLGFAAMVLWTMLTLLTLGYRPLTPAEAGAELAHALPVHDAMMQLFLPAPIFLAAGMTSYLVSQFSDIWVFWLIRRITHARLLWLRAAGSTLISSLIDSIVFSALAWVAFPLLTGGTPVGFAPLLFTYILGTYALRAAVALLEAPFMYLARPLVRQAPDAPAPIAADG